MTARHQGGQPGADDELTVRPPAAAPGLLLRPWTEQDIPAIVDRGGSAPGHPGPPGGTGFSFAVLVVNADGTTGDLAGSVSIRGWLLPEFPADGHRHIRPAGY